MLEKKFFLKKIKEQLEKEKVSIENSLKSFAKKDKKLSEDWDTKFPQFNGSSLEEAADEVEQYESLLPIEFSLENRLKDINSALEKIRTSLSAKTLNASHLKKGEYGKCEKCGKEIPIERLEIYPGAKTCNKCR